MYCYITPPPPKWEEVCDLWCIIPLPTSLTLSLWRITPLWEKPAGEGYRETRRQGEPNTKRPQEGGMPGKVAFICLPAAPSPPIVFLISSARRLEEEQEGKLLIWKNEPPTQQSPHRLSQPNRGAYVVSMTNDCANLSVWECYVILCGVNNQTSADYDALD